VLHSVQQPLHKALLTGKTAQWVRSVAVVFVEKSGTRKQAQ
jgi:hypothetical protein